MPVFAKQIEYKMDIPIVDETGLTKTYNLKTEWHDEDKNVFISELKKLGLELVDGKREIDVLVFYEK